jgi:uncharacterized protein (DUF1501 family)
MISRRAFLKAGSIALFGIGFGGVPEFVTRAVAQKRRLNLFEKKKVLVCIFQRGAMDGLMAITPFTDQYLKEARPNLFMTADSKGTLLDLDGAFGLHPGFKSFYPLFTEKQLAIVHGIGSPNTTRSHFDAQDYMESGTPFNKGTSSGWLNRAVGLLGHEGSPLRAVSLTNSLPRSFYGENPSIAISNLKDFSIQKNGKQPGVNVAAQSFEDLYDQTSNELLKETGKETFEAIDLFQKIGNQNYKPENDASYPGSPLGNALKQICQLIKMDVGLEVAFAESGGWDTHVNQGTVNGIFARNASDLSNSIAAFWKDLGVLQDNVTIMTMTEFGRTVKQNGTGGTDHGRASCNFIIGNDVNGGKVHGVIQPLAKENLEDGRDLRVTTDFRSVFSEVADKHMQLTNNTILFPEWNGNQIGVMK